MDASAFPALVASCAPAVHPATATAIVAVESGFNAHAIGVVGGALLRQPGSRAEAVATARHLQAGGWNYSVGLAQINVGNFARLGLDAATALEPCRNLAAMQAVLLDCFERSGRSGQEALRRALSCYYSGNFSTGFSHGYVDRVARQAGRQPIRDPP
jgi:type IV secretion system protein VirB1